MRRIVLPVALLLLSLTPAMAQLSGQQYITKPTIYGLPDYGTTTTDSSGNTYQTKSIIFGHPAYGTTTTGPGVHCTTKPVVYGIPSSGEVTRCGD